LNIPLRGNCKILVSLDSNKLEFENFTKFVSLVPRLNQVKNAIV